MANTLLMAARSFGMDDDTSLFIETTNYFFAVGFTLEMAIKITGLGPRRYFASGWNRFDAAVVAATDTGIAVSVVACMRRESLVWLLRRHRADGDRAHETGFTWTLHVYERAPSPLRLP